MAESISAGRWHVAHWDRATGQTVHIEGDITVEISVNKIVKAVSARALKSKSGKATALQGAIIVRVSNRTSKPMGE